ncbi:MAG TPA: hypothetical protein VFV97_05845, partial [Rhodanobacteraceae bacterium]|nr:hypothetical protein [Rhodanobacteraceae bacterium]
ARFRDAGIPLLNTAGLGALTIAFPASGKPVATAERARRRRYWRERTDPPCCPLGSPSQSGAAPRCYDSRPSGPCDDA